MLQIDVVKLVLCYPGYGLSAGLNVLTKFRRVAGSNSNYLKSEATGRFDLIESEQNVLFGVALGKNQIIRNHLYSSIAVPMFGKCVKLQVPFLPQNATPILLWGTALIDIPEHRLALRTGLKEAHGGSPLLSCTRCLGSPLRITGHWAG